MNEHGSILPPQKKPPRLLRWFLKIPVLLYRLRLGWILGHRFLLLTHRGRKTGRVRKTVLEVILYNPATSESVVVSGWGKTADWLRNIEARPAISVRTGRDRYRPQHRLINASEAEAVAIAFEKQHPFEVRLVPPVMQALGWSVCGERPTWRALMSEIPLVAFRPR